jgi:hypothetical protein
MAAVLGLADNIVEEVCFYRRVVVLLITTVRTISDFGEMVAVEKPVKR